LLKCPLKINLPVPDLRFEQSYLKSIARYIHPLDNDSEASTSSEQPQTQRTEDKGEKEEAVEDEALVSTIDKPISRDLYRIEWGRVGYVTVRDQVIMPLLQGLVWGVASFYLRPVIGTFLTSIRATNNDISANQRAIDSNGGVNKLRRWTHNLLGGVQTNAALAK